MYKFIDFFHAEVLDEQIIGKSIKEIEKLIDYPMESKCEEEYVYILKKYFFCLLKKRLHLFFHKGIVRDYFIG